MPGPEEDSQLLAHEETAPGLVHSKEAAPADVAAGEEEAAVEGTGELSEISAHDPVYSGNDTSEAELKLTEMATQMADAVKDADTGETYEMVEHGNGGELEEAQYEHEYEQYDMGEVEMTAGEHGEAAQGEYAEAGSILATQENGGQMLDEGHQGEYAYEGEIIDKQAEGEIMHDGQQMYETEQPVYDEGAGEYSMADPSSSLAALSQVITSTAGLDANAMHDEANATPAPQDDGQKEPQDDRYSIGAELAAQQLHSASHSHSPAPAGTPIEYKTGRLMDAQSVTPSKRPLMAMHQAASASRNSRLKSKVWHWYDILDDGFRQCRFCSQKYGPLTATTILNRHYQNRHDQSAPADSTASHRASSSHHSAHLLSQSSQPANSVQYDQRAIAAAAAVAAAAAANGSSTPGQDGQATGHLFHGQGTLAVANGSSTDELLRSVSEVVHNGGQYEENQILMQESFSSMIGSPLSRINLPGARRTLAAVAQFCGHLDMQKNLQTCVALISSAAQRGAKMVFLPEASDFIPERRDQSAQQAQPLDGPFMKEIQQAAKDNSIW
ncbi:Nitrilase, partial [Linderina pennispora]